MNPLEQALNKLKAAKIKLAAEKQAGFWQGLKSALSGSEIGKQVGTAAIGATAAAVLAGGAQAGATGYRAIRDKLQKGKAYKAMVGANPQLKDMDSGAVQRTFNTLYTLNRDLARDPVVSGSFVSKSVTRSDVGGAGSYVDPMTALSLQRGGGGARPGPIAEAFTSGRDFGTPPPRPSEETKHQFARSLEQYKSQLRREESAARNRSAGQRRRYQSR